MGGVVVSKLSHSSRQDQCQEHTRSVPLAKTSRLQNVVLVNDTAETKPTQTWTDSDNESTTTKQTLVEKDIVKSYQTTQQELQWPTRVSSVGMRETKRKARPLGSKELATAWVPGRDLIFHTTTAKQRRKTTLQPVKRIQQSWRSITGSSKPETTTIPIYKQHQSIRSNKLYHKHPPTPSLLSPLTGGDGGASDGRPNSILSSSSLVILSPKLNKDSQLLA